MCQALFQILGIKWRAKALGTMCLEGIITHPAWKKAEPILQMEKPRTKDLLRTPQPRYSEWKCDWGPLAPASPAVWLGRVQNPVHEEILGAWCSPPSVARPQEFSWSGDPSPPSDCHPLLSTFTEFAIVLANECYCTDFTDKKIKA